MHATDAIKSRPQRPSRVTINDVSLALGLTKSTVSRALNGYPDISESTRTRVRSMADKLGYRPLSQAQAIRTGLTKSLGLIIQMADHDAARPFLAEFLAGLSQGASAEGWTLTIATTDSPAATLEMYQSMIRDRKIDGFVLPRTLNEDARVDLLRAAGVPFVLFGRLPDPTDCAWHDVLGEEAMRDAVQHLVGLGHRSIGFINGGQQYTYARLRDAGFRAAMRQAGLELDPTHVKQDAVTRADGEAAALEILASPAPPTAIVCAVDMAALGAYRAAEARGLQIGRDLSVISYDGTPDGAHVTPQLTTFAVDFIASGRSLATLLIRRIKGEPPEALRETVPATFLDRGSAAAPALQSAEIAAVVANHTT